MSERAEDPRDATIRDLRELLCDISNLWPVINCVCGRAPKRFPQEISDRVRAARVEPTTAKMGNDGRLESAAEARSRLGFAPSTPAQQDAALCEALEDLSPGSGNQAEPTGLPMPETLRSLSARLDKLMSDAYDAWSAAVGMPAAEPLAALHDGLQKTVWGIRATGAPIATAQSTRDALPLFSEER